MRFLLLLLLLTWNHAQGEDWPQFLGPSRNGVYSGPAPASAWAKSGPPMVWKIDVGQGFSAPVVARGRVILFHRLENRAIVESLDAATGKVLWTATNDEAGYSAPVAATFDGVHHALFFTRNALVDVDPVTGKVRFTFPWRSRSHASVNAAAPVIAGNFVFLSAS